MSVERGRNTGMRHLQINFVSELVFVSENRVRRANVRVVNARVVASHVREPEVPFRVERHSGVVDRFELALIALQHPVHFRLRVAIWGFAGQFERFSFIGFDHLLAVRFLEGVEFRSSDEDRVGRGDTPLVDGKALVLPKILFSRLADDEGTSAGLLRDTVVVTRVFEGLAVLYPFVPVDDMEFYNRFRMDATLYGIMNETVNLLKTTYTTTHIEDFN